MKFVSDCVKIKLDPCVKTLESNLTVLKIFTYPRCSVSKIHEKMKNWSKCPRPTSASPSSSSSSSPSLKALDVETFFPWPTMSGARSPRSLIPLAVPAWFLGQVNRQVRDGDVRNTFARRDVGPAWYGRPVTSRHAVTHLKPLGP